MKKNVSAGILLYRFSPGGLQVLLVHPGGPYFRHKDLGSWSIPKGLVDEGEDLLTAAKREFSEELGQPVPADKFVPLPPIRQESGKMVFAWAVEGNVDVSEVCSNTLKMEFPYKSGKWIDVPEIDKAAWFDVATARQKILPAQLPLVDGLEAALRL